MYMTNNGYTQGISIDGVFYDIPFVEIKRNADFLEKYAERNEAGKVIMETIGVYYNYTVKIGIIEDPELYSSLFNHITDPEHRIHTVTLPNGMNDFTFKGYFSSISDEVSKVLEQGVKFKGLTWKMTSEDPTRKG